MATKLAIPSPEEMVSSVTKLTSFPEVAFRINEVLTDDVSNADDISAIIEIDPALTAALLRIANTPLYSVAGGIDSVKRAVTVVGLNNIRDIAFGVSAAMTFQGISNCLISVEDFWKHSLYCAVSANFISKKTPLVDNVSPFTCGLLHDIGQLVMFNQCPELSRDSLLKALDDNDCLEVNLSEKAVFGYDHAEVGGLLAENWGLPKGIVEAIRYHHDPFAGNEPRIMPAIIQLANCAAVLSEIESTNLDDAPKYDKNVCDFLKVPEDLVINASIQARLMVPDLVSMFSQPAKQAS